MSERTVKQNIYDSVFTNLFKDPQYQLQLYKDLHPEDVDVTEADISNVTLEAVFLNQLYNDLGFTVGDKSIFLIEAQSTWCANMAFRALRYLAETLKEYVLSTNQNYYSERAISLPSPELYVLYTGDKEHKEDFISLADTHWSGDDSFLDVKVKVLYGDEDDAVLSQYAAFIRIYKRYRNEHGETETAVLAAIDECIRLGILKEYLTQKKTEVVNIMMSLFDAQQNQEMFANSEREAGRLQERLSTIRRLLQKMSKKEVMEFGYTVEEIDMAEMSAV